MSPSLRQQLPDDIVLYGPQSSQFEAIAAPFNTKLTQRPQWIVQPQTPDQVQAIIRACRVLELAIGVRGAGFGSQTGGRPAVLIDPRRLDAIALNPATATARIQAGVTVGALDQHTTPHQLAAVAPRFAYLNSVGVCLGGGTGLLSRLHGWAAAHIQRAQLITNRGDLVTVDANHHPDLLWALRGAGQNNFGMVTELELALHPIPEHVWGGAVQWPLDQAPQIMAQLPALLDAYGDRLLLDLSLRTQDPAGPVCELFGLYLGDPTEGQAAFQQLSQLAPHPTHNHGRTTYLALQSTFQDPQGRKPAFVWHHGFVHPAQEATLVAKIAARMLAAQDLELRLKLEPMGSTHLSARCPLQQQRSQYLYVAAGIWKTPEQATRIHAWFEDTATALADQLTGFGHPNYHDRTVQDPASYYFGHQVEPLRHLKQKWDPDGCFGGLLQPQLDR